VSWFRIRTPVLSWRWLLLIASVRGLWRLLRWLAAHGAVTLGLAAAGLLAWVISRGGALWLLMVAGAVLVGLGVLMEMRPRWYRQVVEALASRRRLRELERLWEPAMDGAGLSRPDTLPELLAHRWGGQLGERDLDVLTVHMLPGQLVEDWRQQRVRLAAALGYRKLRPHLIPGQSRDVELYGSRYRDLAPGISERRAEPHPTVQPTVQPARPEKTLQLVEDPESTPVEQPVERPAGAFPRTPRRTQ
jgi:hypothetical protein